MGIDSASFAKSITWGASKQTYYTVKFMVDKELVDHAYRAYAYFRWVDDAVDIHSTDKRQSIDFIQSQQRLIDRCWGGNPPSDLLDEEWMLVDLIREFPDQNGEFAGYFESMMSIIEFDAQRRGRPISSEELEWYSATLAEAVMHAIQHFIGNRYDYPKTPNRTHAAIGAHIAHMLRDTHEDVNAGFFNIPREYLETHQIQPTDYDSIHYREWVEQRVYLARKYTANGMCYLQSIENLRYRLVGHWYCARFDDVLRAIEKDDHLLRPEYPEQKKPSAWLRMAWLGLSLPVRHLLTKGSTASPSA
jgi:phytoene/squalene synthetase